MNRRPDDATGNWDLILDNLHESIIVTDAEGYITNWNKGAENLFGHTAQEAIGQHAGICHPRSPEAMEREIIAPLQRDGRLEIFGKMVRKSGETFDGHMLASLITAPDGTVTGMVGYTLDVTERTRIEEDLKASEARLANAQRIAKMGNWEYDPASGEIWWSDQVYRIVGVAPGGVALDLDYILTLCHPDDRQAMQTATQQAVDGGGTYSIDHRLVRADGVEIFVHEQGEVIRDETGAVASMTGTVQDITDRTRTQEALRRSEHFLGAAQRIAHLGTWDWNPKTEVLWWSDEIYRLFSIEPIGCPVSYKSFMKIVQPDDVTRVKAFLSDAVNQAQPVSIDYRIIRPDGSERFIHGRAEPLYDTQGTLIRTTGTVHDITDRRRTEDVLRRSEARLEEAQRIAHLGSWDYDLINGTVWWSDQISRLLGLDPENRGETYESMMDFIHPGDRARVDALTRESAEKGTAISYDCRLIRADGKERFARISGEAVRDDNGNVVRLVGTTLDVTQQKRAEIALQDAHDDLERRVARRTSELRTTLETLIEGVITIDDRGVIESFNRSAEALFGYDSGDVVGQNVSTLMTSEDSGHHDHSIRNYLKTGDAKIIGIGRDVVGRRNDGTTFPLRLGIGEMEIDGQRKFVGTVQDVSDQKGAEDALRKSEGMFRALAENTSDYTLLIGLDGIITYASPAVERTSGYTVEEVVGQNYESFALPDDIDVVRAAFGRAHENPNETHKASQFRTRRKDGCITYYEALVTDMTQVEGVEGIVVNMRDTTDRALMEQQADVASAKTQELQQRMDDALESIRDGFLLCDAEDRIVLCNDAYYNDFQSIREFLAPGTPFEDFLRALYETEGMVANEFRTEERIQKRLEVHKNPETGPWLSPAADGRWILVNEYRTSHGGTALIRSDVTERVTAQKALAERESELRTLTDLSPVGIYRSGPDGLLTYVNDTWRKIIGIKGDAALDDAWIKSMHPDDRDPVIEAWQNFVTHELEKYSIDCRMIRPGGSIAWLISQAARHYDENGELLGYVGSITDVTELKKAQLDLTGSEEKFRAITENTSDVIVILDQNGIHKYISPSAARASGDDASTFLGKSVYDIIHPEDINDFRMLLQRAWSHPGETNFLPEFRMIYPDGGKILFEALFTALPNVPGVDGIVLNARDITDRKRAESELVAAKETAEVANRAKTDFLSSMSHELRTPMNAVLGFAQLMEQSKSEPLGETNQEFVGEILRAGRHMIDLINGVLDLEKVEHGDIPIDLKDREPGSLIATCLKMIGSVAEQGGITVTNRIPDNGLPNIRIDELRFRQALLNLLSNAVKYNRANGEVIVDCLSVATGMLRISVADTGLGIPEDMRDRVFEPFDRLGAEKSNTPGTGIGLAVSKQLIELMGGNIGFESTVGEGATFWIEVPLASSKTQPVI